MTLTRCKYVPALRAQNSAPRALPLTMDGLHTATRQAPDDFPSLPQAERPTAGPSTHMITLPRTVTSSYKGGTRRIQEYLADDKDLYIPSPRTVRDQKSLILSQICSAIESLLDLWRSISATQTYENMDYAKVPRIYQALSDDDLRLVHTHLRCWH